MKANLKAIIQASGHGCPEAKDVFFHGDSKPHVTLSLSVETPLGLFSDG